MDHGHALATKASERYLLGEMSEIERFDFEGHYFVCEACAEDVRTGAALARGMKAVFAADELKLSRDTVGEKAGWFKWISLPALVPSAAAVVLATVTAYQSFVIMPSMRAGLAAQAMEPVVLRAASRGQEPAVEVDRTTGVSVFSIDVNVGEPGQRIGYEVVPPDGGKAITGEARVPAPGKSLAVVLANA